MPSAGENQLHVIRNVFNVLGNHGFLRDQGVLTLETVQEFYRLIREKPKPASMKVSKLLDFCPPSVEICELDNQPVITLMKTSSISGQVSSKSVVLKSYDKSEDFLDLTTDDPLSETGETYVECSIFDGDKQKTLAIGELPDQWSLGSKLCYFLTFSEG